jgi:hypothetical protein
MIETQKKQLITLIEKQLAVIRKEQSLDVESFKYQTVLWNVLNQINNN